MRSYQPLLLLSCCRATAVVQPQPHGPPACRVVAAGRMGGRWWGLWATGSLLAVVAGAVDTEGFNFVYWCCQWVHSCCQHRCRSQQIRSSSCHCCLARWTTAALRVLTVILGYSQATRDPQLARSCPRMGLNRKCLTVCQVHWHVFSLARKPAPLSSSNARVSNTDAPHNAIPGAPHSPITLPSPAPTCSRARHCNHLVPHLVALKQAGEAHPR